MQQWTQRYPQIVCLHLSRNFGKEAALMAGLETAQGRVVVTMDADMQHPPSLIPRMFERWRDGVEMVYAVRTSRRDESIFKRLGARMFYKLMRGSHGLHVPPNASDFRLMDRAVIDSLLLLPERNRFMKGLFAWVGFRAEAFPYSPPERLHGKTFFKPWRLFGFAIDGLTAFTTWPLHLVSVVGIVLSLLSFAYGVYIVITYLLYGDPVQGWATLITLILFFSGVNLISLGVVGEYVARIFNEVKGRPLYLVSRRVGQGMQAGSASGDRTESSMNNQA
jgi:glycosyltransferase involved in cell wall biosynthesis